MNRTALELMLEHVRSIHKAVAGSDLPPPAENAPPAADPQIVIARFAHLDAVVRMLPPLAERVAPFAFAPPIDLIELEKEIVVEIALPGVERDNVEVEVADGQLIVSGVRPSVTDGSTNGFGLRHAEIPRGPFRRVIPLPPDTSAEPLRVEELQQGMLRIHLNRVSAGKRVRA